MKGIQWKVLLVMIVPNSKRLNQQKTLDQQRAILQNDLCIQQFVDKINTSTECRNIGIHFGPCKIFKGKLEPKELSRLVTYRRDDENKLSHKMKYPCQSLNKNRIIFESEDNANFVLYRANIATALIHASA